MTPPVLRRGPSGQAGFTLIEVLVSGLILAVGILGASKLLVSSESASVDAELQQLATQEAEQAIEDARALDYDEIGHPAGDQANGGTPFQAPDAPEAEDIVVAKGGGGIPATRSLQVERGAGQPPVDVTVETYVTWRDEECELLSLGGIPGISNLLGALSGLLEPTVSGVVGIVQQTLSKLVAVVNGILDPLLPDAGRLEQELEALGPLIDTVLAEVDDVVEVLGDLQELEVDLCDLSLVELEELRNVLEVNLGGIAALSGDLVDLNALLGQLQGPLQTLLSSTVGQLVCVLLQPVCKTVNDTVDAALEIVDPPGETPPETLLGALDQTLTELADLNLAALSGNSTHNTKRITVAVTIDGLAADQTPKNPVWLSTVATDPLAGLLIDADLL